MAPLASGATIIVGIGNPDRGDDAAGREAAKRLRGALADDIEIVELDGDATELLAVLQRANVAYLVDACVSGAPPGFVRRLDVAEAPSPQAGFRLSSHGLGLAEALELAKALGAMPAEGVVYAIEGANFGIGEPMSEAAHHAVDVVVERIKAEIEERVLQMRHIAHDR